MEARAGDPMDLLRHTPLRRYREVVQVLVRHGFGYLVAQLGLGHLVPFHWGLLGHPRRPLPYTPAEHLRLALEELGTTFIKLGQILSTRVDLLPPEYIAELAKLQDAVPPAPPAVIEKQIAQELGQPPTALFARFDWEPLGSASIGQVHAARLRTGEEVVVKVQRPGIEELIEADLTILRDLARLAQARTPWGQVYDLVGMVEEFAQTLRAELDYIREGRNAERIARNFAGDPVLRVPRIYWRYTTRRVLTMERLYGIKISDLAALEAAGIDRRRVAREGLRIVLKMIFEDGFFHADPHPGNFLVQPGPIINLLDYGMVGWLDETTRENLLLLLMAVVDQDVDRAIDRLIALGIVGTTEQYERLRRDLAHLLALYWGLPLRQIDARRVMDEFWTLARRHRLVVPASLTLMSKTLAMHEGLARHLDPQINLAALLAPRVHHLVWRVFLPRRWRQHLRPALLDLSLMVTTLPRRLDRLLNQAERGNIALNMRLQETEHMLDTLNRLVNRLILTVLVAALALGLVLLLQVYQTVGLHGLVSWFLGAAFAAITGLAFWLVLTTLRRGHH